MEESIRASWCPVNGRTTVRALLGITLITYVITIKAVYFLLISLRERATYHPYSGSSPESSSIYLDLRLGSAMGCSPLFR
jgi:amino acid permease